MYKQNFILKHLKWNTIILQLKWQTTFWQYTSNYNTCVPILVNKYTNGVNKSLESGENFDYNVFEQSAINKSTRNVTVLVVILLNQTMNVRLRISDGVVTECCTWYQIYIILIGSWYNYLVLLVSDKDHLDKTNWHIFMSICLYTLQCSLYVFYA